VDSTDLGQSLLSGCCENSDRFCVVIEIEEFLNQLGNYQKKYGQ
jgi:hypothetical protein